MRIAQMLAEFGDSLDEMILALYEEMDALVAARRISTINGMIALFREIDAKYRLAAIALDADPDLFEDLVRHCEPAIFCPTYGQLIPYTVRTY